MQLLDASLAFILTLAGLATVVTTIMEACFRIARMRKKNLIEVMKLLNSELGKGALKFSPEERWTFFAKVVENPVKAVGLVNKINWPKSDKEKGQALETFLSSFGNRVDRKGIYDKVTLEYMLRCLSQIDSVKHASLEAGEMLKVELNRIARKYEEFGSAVSAHFKQHAQVLSIGIGILLALAANIDGLRIFEAYRADPQLAATVIEQQETIIEKNEKIQKEVQSLEGLLLKKKQKQIEIDSAKDAPDRIKQLKTQLADIQNEIDEKAGIETIKKNILDAKAQVSDLRALGLPIGWNYYPCCPYGKSEDEWKKSCPQCKALHVPEDKALTCNNLLGCLSVTIAKDTGGFMAWLFKTIITGFLIGLGAPFWFDVAKRLSLIRRGLKNPNASDEDRLAARDANGDQEERNKIVEDVVSDLIKEASASASEQAST